MLVLVSQLIEVCFGILKHKLETLIAVLLLCVPAFCDADTSCPAIDSDSTSQVGPPETSVLVLVESESSESAAENQESSNPPTDGQPVIDERSSGNATFTARPLSPAPSPPQDLLVPANPSESSFTRPLANELRGETLVPAANPATSDGPSEQPQSASDGSQAIGTFATTNQSLQDQPSFVRPQFEAPDDDRSFAQPPLRNAGQFVQPTRSVMPPINSSDQFSSRTPSLPNSASTMAAPISDQPSAWRDASSTGQESSNSNSFGLAPMNQQAPNVRSFSDNENRTGRGQLPSQSGTALANPYDSQTYGQTIDRDANVRPTGFTQPIPQSELTTDLAKLLMNRYSADDTTDALPGRPTKLIDMLREPIPPQQRRAMVHQYWETYYDWANYMSAREYEQWLKRVPASLSPADKAMLDAAIAVASNKTLAAEIQLGKSQSGLVQYMPNWRSTDTLPLPNDLPLIQRYKTNYELYRSRQMMPVSLRGIDEMLPKTLELITLRAEAVKVSKTAADQVLSGLAAGRSVMPVLESGRVWRTAELDLVASVVSYNQAIGDYSLSVTGGNQSPEQIVAMLIAKPQSVVAQAPRGPAQQPQFEPGANAQFQRPQFQTPVGNQAQTQPLPNASVVQGGNSNFNLGPPGAFGSNPTGTGNNGQNGLPPGQFAPPNNTDPFGDSRAADARNGFGPQIPR